MGITSQSAQCEGFNKNGYTVLLMFVYAHTFGVPGIVWDFYMKPDVGRITLRV